MVRSSTPAVRSSAPVVGGPWRAARLGIGLLERLLLGGRRRVLRQPGVAQGCPGGRQEAVQAAGSRRAVDGGRVTAALALDHALLEAARCPTVRLRGRRRGRGRRGGTGGRGCR